jgi:hypothetical protein
MFTLKWIRAMVVFTFFALALPSFAQGPGGYDRMDGDFIKPSKREQPKRNFNNITKEPLNVYRVKRSGNPRSETSAQYTATTEPLPQNDSGETRRAKDRSIGEQALDAEANEVEVPTEALTGNDGDSKAATGYETAEAADVIPEEAAPEVLPARTVDPNQLVFCSKRLMEFHWDQDCPMLKNVRPTRLTFSDAKEARYTECTACGGKR